MKYFVSVLFVAACGPKSAPTTTTTGTGEPAKVTLPDAPFDELDHEQREEFMKQQVMPAMEPIFKKHDPQKFAEFTCKTCHSDDGHHDMPNLELPKLTKDMSKFEKADIEWMTNEVKPLMAKLLREDPWSPENPQGFGCHGCHTTE